MRPKDKTAVVVIAIIAAVLSSILANALFGPAKHNASVPVVQDINTSMPDIKNDSDYNSFLYNGAFDPSQPVQTGSSQNQTPFNSSP